MNTPYTLGFIGAGNMAEAIARAALDGQVLEAGQMIAADPSPERRQIFTSLGIAVTEDSTIVAREAKQVMLAVKPQMFGTVASTVASVLEARQIIISIMAGLSTQKINTLLNEALPAGHPQTMSTRRIVRVMPNTPLMVGLGMSGVALGSGAEPGDETLTLQLFGAAGKTVLVDEKQLDAITAVSGSGPAYLFYLAEGMEKAAQELGLGDDARLLVQQTLLGAATLLAQSADTAAQLRKKVTSPGGTTEAAIRHLEGNRTLEVIVNALKAAQKRAEELGK